MKIGDKVNNSFNDLRGTIVKIETVAGQKSYWVEYDNTRHVFYQDELTLCEMKPPIQSNFAWPDCGVNPNRDGLD